MEENVADLGGMNAIVAALKLIQINDTIAPSLPGLSHYTNEQLMLVRTSQVRIY